MKSARFTKVVQSCGRPQTYLLLMDPARDSTFQRAIKESRVMTVFQEAVGTRTDRGEVGFHPGHGRQFLIFSKSLAAFAGRSIVGIKYDLISEPEVPMAERAKKPKAPKRPKAKSPPNREESEPPVNVVAFSPRHEREKGEEEGVEEGEDGEEIALLKTEIRRAMSLLEDGKAVAAFNHLKRMVE